MRGGSPFAVPPREHLVVARFFLPPLVDLSALALASLHEAHQRVASCVSLGALLQRGFSPRFRFSQRPALVRLRGRARIGSHTLQAIAVAELCLGGFRRLARGSRRTPLVDGVLPGGRRLRLQRALVAFRLRARRRCRRKRRVRGFAGLLT